MSEDFFTIRERLRSRYAAPAAALPTGEAIGGEGFLTEIAGRVILTAPAKPLAVGEELPPELAERWEKASVGNPYMMWLQGRFVEAEKANRNGAFWSTADLQFGEMSVKHGPLNWLHDETTVIGTIADNALIHPRVPELADLSAGQPRPYMAAVSAVWKWVHPGKVAEIERAAEANRLFYSMECVGREMECVSDETRQGCGKVFDYITAMTRPEATCEHIAARTSARRMVDPSFLGGAVIVPPVQPGWGSANVEILRQQASALAEQTHEAAGDMSDSQWESLMAQVVRYAWH